MSQLTPLPDKILVWNMTKGERKIGSIIIHDDDRSGRGIRPRWAQVYRVGEKVRGIENGEWILIEHGRWTRPFKLVIEELSPDPVEIFGVDPSCIMLKSDIRPEDGYLNKD